MDQVRAGNRIIVVGAGAAGLAVARAYREHGGQNNVILVSHESRLPYERPPLTKEFLRQEIDDDELTIESASWFEEQRIDLLLGAYVTALDAERASIKIGDETLYGDAVVLATGAEPLRPGIPGLDDPRVLTVREYGDSEMLAREATPGTHVAVLGTGFIGCEIAASLAMNGAEVTLIGQEPAPQTQRLGEDASSRIASWLEELGVSLSMNAQVTAVHEARTVALAAGTRLEADLVVVAMGVAPRSTLARDAGLEIRDGRIGTDERMRAAARIFAVGDVAYAFNQTARRRLAVEHWGDAIGQGEIAGRVLAGDNASWDAVPGFWSTIGHNTLKYAAWGDGYDSFRVEEHPQGAFTVWYQRHGVPVGVLAHGRDDDYQRGSELIRDEGPQSW